MKRKIFVTTLATALVLGMTACGTGSVEDAGSDNGKNDSQITMEATKKTDHEKTQSDFGGDKEDNQNRQAYTLSEVNEGILDNTITFNSITDASIGNEFNFTSAQEADVDGNAVDPHGEWNGNNITAEDGKEYIVRIFIHNNNPGGKDSMATGTKVAISGIGQSEANKDGKQEVEVNGFIKSDNATPQEYWDNICFNSNTSFHLDYVYGSAIIYNRGAVGTTDSVSSADIPNKTDADLQSQTITGRPLSDDIVLKAGSEDGTLIGFDALDGNVPGCYEYSSYITIRVKAVYDK